MLWIILILSAVALDQATKYLITSNLRFEEQIPVIDKFFYITYWRNKGAAWGILQNQRFIFITLTVIMSVVFVFILFKTNNKMYKLSISLILSGALGNLIDRVFQGSVVDFLQFFIGSYQYPVFNVADMCVVIGTVILAIYMLFFQKDTEERKVEE
jgi:signal peptidase II